MYNMAWGCPRISAQICMDRETRNEKKKARYWYLHGHSANRCRQKSTRPLLTGNRIPVGCVSGVLGSISGNLSSRTLGAIHQGQQPLSGLPATLHHEWMPRKDAKKSRDRWSHRLNGMESKNKCFYFPFFFSPQKKEEELTRKWEKKTRK